MLMEFVRPQPVAARAKFQEKQQGAGLDGMSLPGIAFSMHSGCSPSRTQQRNSFQRVSSARPSVRSTAESK